MKKQVLSIEQMKHLKEFNLDINNSGMVCIFQDDYGEIISWDEVICEYKEHGDTFQYFRIDEEGFHVPAYMYLLDSIGGIYDHSYKEDCAVFTLQDMIELMPESFKYDGNVYYLEIHKNSFGYTEYEEYESMYASNEDSIINNAYNTLIWLLENKYI